MTDSRNMTPSKLADYYDPKLPDSAIITVPNGLLGELVGNPEFPACPNCRGCAEHRCKTANERETNARP